MSTSDPYDPLTWHIEDAAFDAVGDNLENLLALRAYVSTV